MFQELENATNINCIGGSTAQESHWETIPGKGNICTISKTSTDNVKQHEELKLMCLQNFSFLVV